MDRESIQELLTVKDWHTVKSFAKVASLLLVLSIAILVSINSLTPLNLNLQDLLILLSIPQLAHLLLWIFHLIKRKIPPIKQNKLNIIFAVKTTEASKKLYEKILESFKRVINEIDEFNNFNIADISSSYTFDDSIKAMTFADQEGIELLVWGYTEEGLAKNENVNVFKFNFTYNFRISANSKEDIIIKTANFKSTVDKSLYERRWDIIQSESLDGIKVVSTNVTEVSLFIVSLTLLSYGYVRLAYEYLLRLNVRLSQVHDKTKFPGYEHFKIRTNNLMLQACILTAQHFLLKEKNLVKAEYYMNESLKINNNEFATLTLSAIIMWKKGDKSAAYRYAKRAHEVNPTSDINRFNTAFFSLDSGDFHKALNMYKKIKSLPKEFNIFYVIEFIETEYSKTGNPAMLFGAGYLNLTFGDELLGRELLQQFLRLVQNKTEYKELIQYTRAILIYYKHN